MSFKIEDTRDFWSSDDIYYCMSEVKWDMLNKNISMFIAGCRVPLSDSSLFSADSSSASIKSVAENKIENFVDF